MAGLLGGIAGTVMLWVEQSRVAPFEVAPWAAGFALVDLPNVLIFSALIFSVAAVSRAQAWAWATGHA